MLKTPRREIEPNFDGLHFVFSADGRSMSIFDGQECVWTGSVTAWSYAVANPAKAS